jgi:hypothetical protein
MDGHSIDRCWSPGGGAERQGPSSEGKKKGKGGKKGKAAVQENNVKPAQQQGHATEDHAYMSAASLSFALHTTAG